MVTSGPACKAVPASFVNVISKMPAPPADALCSWLLRGNASLITTCDGLAIVETGLSKDTSRQACDPGAQAAYPLTGGPTPLADARPLPPGDFDDVPATYAAEGATYHWLYSLVRRLEDWLPCAAEGRAWPPPPGWLLVRELTLDEGGAQPLLFGVVLASEDGGQLVVAVRGTMTAYEWGLDWQYNQVGSERRRRRALTLSRAAPRRAGPHHRVRMCAKSCMNPPPSLPSDGCHTRPV